MDEVKHRGHILHFKFNHGPKILLRAVKYLKNKANLVLCIFDSAESYSP